MNFEMLKYNVDRAIDTLTALQQQGYTVESEQDLEWKGRFFELKDAIDGMMCYATALLSDMQANGLTIGTADAEGFWRGIKSLSEIAKRIAKRDADSVL